MAEGALKTGRGLKANSMILVKKGTCTVVERISYLYRQIKHCPESVADVFEGYGK